MFWFMQNIIDYLSKWYIFDKQGETIGNYTNGYIYRFKETT